MLYGEFFKPLGDRFFALILLVALSPIIAVTALVVRISLGSPVFFRQTRPGQNGKLFSIYKFRTMKNVLGADGKPLPDRARLTKMGNLLRSLSLDELPQLVNVLRGEMSFIGPRPLLPEYLPRYNARQARRHLVRPGITGLAQVSGRNALDWQSRLALDVRYAENLTAWLDARIFFLTIYKVLKRDGISGEGEATKEPFLGNYDRVFVFGGGGHGRVVAESAARMGLRVEGFIDQNPERGIGYEEFLLLARREHFGVALAIGENRARQQAAERLRHDGARILQVIDPSAAISTAAHIGEGAVVLAQAVVGAGARVEEGAIINHAAIVDHDCVVGAYAHISPNATLAGGAKAGALSHIGIGASLIQNVQVGKAATIGAGAVVLGEIAPFATAVGVPAKAI
ncbi:UDP-N-acetylgalactosaminyltransferase [Campylobacterota bacterium]|nr:UDP-N-acetylgalactosaminyltransferase [Campylobacterota bacterium]